MKSANKYPNAEELQRLDRAMHKLKYLSRDLLVRRVAGELLVDGDGASVKALRERGLVVGWKPTALGIRAAALIKVQRAEKAKRAEDRRAACGKSFFGDTWEEAGAEIDAHLEAAT